MILSETGILIRNYFRSKAKELLAISEQAICEHSGLKGSHREDVIKIYLNDIVPKRYDIGQGMIYGAYTRSHETDIVLWNSINFPSLRMNGHSMYFAESVQAAIEVKSQYNADVEKDISQKTYDLKRVILNYTPTIEERLFNIECNLESIKSDFVYEGCLSSSKRIKSVAIIFKGGTNFSVKNLEKYDELDEQWPDLILFLDAGKVCVKISEFSDDNSNSIVVFDAGVDALLIFTLYLLEILSEQVVLTEGKLYFEDYIIKQISEIPYEEYKYSILRPGEGFKQAIYSNRT